MAIRARGALFTGVFVLVTVLAGCGLTAPAPIATPPASATASGGAQSWQQALGPGVTITEPATPSPGFGSPGASVAGQANVTSVTACDYYEPSAQADCRKIFKEVPKADLGTMTGFKLGYVAVDGNEALVGSSGTQCLPEENPKCITNRDPAAIFSTGQSFATLWTESVEAADSSVFSYSLTPCLRIDGRWYGYFPTGQPSNA
jgi:hypothetical protein